MKSLGLWLAAASAAGLCACGGAGSSAASASASAPVATAPAPVSTAPASAPALSATAVLTPEGWGSIRVAMSEAQALAALGDGWRPDEGSGEPTACHFLRSGAESPVVLMVENGRVSRITVQQTAAVAATPRTERGVGLGATEAEVRAAYTGVREEPDRYDPNAKSIYWWSVGAPTGDEYVQNEMARGLRFELGQDGRVTAIHAGGPSIQLAEGCS